MNIQLLIMYGTIIEYLLMNGKLLLLSYLIKNTPFSLSPLFHFIFNKLNYKLSSSEEDNKEKEKENEYDICCNHISLNKLLYLLKKEFENKELNNKREDYSINNLYSLNNSFIDITKSSLWYPKLEGIINNSSVNKSSFIKEKKEDILNTNDYSNLNVLQNALGKDECGIWTFAIALVTNNHEALTSILSSSGCLNKESVSNWKKNSTLGFEFFYFSFNGIILFNISLCFLFIGNAIQNC